MRRHEFLILRHGETEWNRAGRVQGRLDSPLTETGKAQAERQRVILREFGVQGWDWYASPQGRAMATARIALGAHKADITRDPRLCEIDMGDWSGLLRDTVRQEVPQLFADGGLGWYDHAPGGERLTGLAARAGAFLDDLSGPAVIVTHGITSRVLRCLALDLPISAFDSLPGGQGIAHHVSQNTSRVID